MHVKVLSAKSQPCYIGLNVLINTDLKMEFYLAIQAPGKSVQFPSCHSPIVTWSILHDVCKLSH